MNWTRRLTASKVAHIVMAHTGALGLLALLGQLILPGHSINLFGEQDQHCEPLLRR